MKKIFIAVSALIMVAVVVVIIILNTGKINVQIEFKEPSVIRVYNESTNPTVNTGYDSKTDEYSKLIDKVSKITNLSYYQRLTNLNTLETNIEVSDKDTYIKWSSDIKSKYLVVEFEFTDEQDVVVYENGNTRVISYYCLSYVITKTKDFTDVLVYYSTTNSSSQREESYAKCQPLILKGFVSDIVEYADIIQAKASAENSSN